MASWKLMTPEDMKAMYQEILGHNGIAAEVLGLFDEKSQGYSGSAINFGTDGEMIEISRKYWKLFGILVEEQESGPENVEEICMDMVGHLLLMIYHLRQEDTPLSKHRPRDLICRCGGSGNSCEVHPMRYVDEAHGA